jgi:phosphatidylglycerophosphate synthase
VIRQAALYLATADDVQAARRPVAGRPVAFRALLAALRAGASRIVVPVVLRSPAFDAAVATSPSARAALVWLDAAGALPAEPTLLLPATALAPAPALSRMLEAPPGRMLAESPPGGTSVVTVDGALLAVLRDTLVAGAPLGDLLERELKNRDLAVSHAAGSWFVRVTGERTAAEAEDRLWRELGSAIDSPLDTAVHRRLSRPVTRVAVARGIAPNTITITSGLVGLAAAAAFAQGDAVAVVVGLLLYLAAVVLDHADGEVARLTLTESAMGEWLDISVDTLVHVALVLALGVAANRVADGGGTAAVVAAAGVVASAAVGKLRPPAPPSAGPRRPLDALTSRDGFYGMLILFLAVRLATPSLLPALMVLIAAGIHTYWIARLIVVMGRRAG